MECKMNKYKVEFERKETYVFDVFAENEEKAKGLATKKYAEADKNGILHYNESKDPETEVSMVYDVTDTDDPFNFNP